MELDRSFNPVYGAGQTLSVTATSQVVVFGGRSRAFCVTNLGSTTAYVRVGDAAGLTATTADYPVLAGAQVSLSKSAASDRLAAVCGAADTTTLHVIPGEGI